MKQIINEHIYKNNILYDESNAVDFYLIEKLTGKFELNIGFEKKYSFLIFEVSGFEQNISIVLDGITLLEIDKDGVYCVPLQFTKESVIEVSGVCKKLLIKLYGNKFKNKKRSAFLPLNKIFAFGGQEKKAYHFEDENAVVDDAFVDYGVSNFINIQTYIKDGVVGLGKLCIENGLKFYNSFDSFESFIEITDDVITDAIFLQNYDDNCINFVYIKNNKVYFKRYDLLFSSLSEECEIVVNNTGVLSLVMSSLDSYNSKFFGVVGATGVSIFVINENLLVQKVYETASRDVRLFEFGDMITVVVFNNYTVKIMEFLITLSNNGDYALVCKNSNMNSNVIDVIVYNDMYIYTSVGGVKSVVSD